jgi:DNA-binding LytR/AlgR family response regulator
MPELSGLELATSLRNKTKFLIFTTSHSAHALKAFDLNADQYLLKPFSFAKFALAINFLLKKNTADLQNDLSRRNIQINETNLKFIKADQKNAYHYIDPTEIVFIEAAKNYVIIYTKDEKYLTHMGLNHIEDALDSNNFIRVNRSYIIAKNAIKKIAGNNIMLKNDKNIQLGNTYKTAFLEFMNKNMLSN